LFSGLLKCGVCDASFVIRNRLAYACASHWNGGEHACTNRINVSHTVVQDTMLAGMREDLTDPAILDEVELQFNAALRRASAPTDHGRRIAQLRGEIDNLVQAISTGGLKGSAAIAQRLQAAEAELLRLQGQQQTRRTRIIVPNIRGRFLELLPRAGRNSHEEAREESRRVTWNSGRRDPATAGRIRQIPVGRVFAWISSTSPKCGNYGSGGMIRNYNGANRGGMPPCHEIFF
jgi:hypothetical protein